MARLLIVAILSLVLVIAVIQVNFTAYEMIGLEVSPYPGDTPINTVSPVKSEPKVMLASWYGEPFHGRLTASGKVFDMFKLSAACLDLPIGKWIRAKNPRNGRSVEMEITDPGPYIEGRDLDVSMEAALELGFAYDGLAFLIVEIIDPPKFQKNSPI